MSFEKKKENDLDLSACRPKSVEEAVGSHYALQVALQTMKERCQHLQQRLGAVEEENLNLRIENRKLRSECTNTTEVPSGNPRCEIDRLEEKVAQLTRQKSQLTHHLFMVATENRQLWNRLSHLTQANQNLGSHLSKISHTLSRHNSASSIPTKPPSPTSSLTANDSQAKKSIETSCNKETVTSEESLEEISLKLIKSFLQEKTELEEQYAQMVEIQSDSSPYSVQNMGFGYLEDGEETIEDMKEHHKTLLELRDVLQEQQTMMKTAIGAMERAKKGGAVCSSCRDKGKQHEEMEMEMESLRKWGIPDGTLYNKGIRRQLVQVAEPPSSSCGAPVVNENRICPMCSKLYVKGTPYATFEQHVCCHFKGEESYSIINTSEIITQ